MYFELPELPGKPMFRCERRHATLQVSACAAMWSAANARECPDRLDACRNCSLGAKHAGAGEISCSPLRGASVCARCHSGATRLVRKHLCVSCANREYEYDKGANARGTFPVAHPPLHKRAIRYLAGESVGVISMRCASANELIVATLRDSSRPVVFGFMGAMVEHA